MSDKAKKTRILFVDDEPQVLKLLQLMLRPMATEWDVACTHSGDSALALMASNPFEIIVSDMRMPGMNGAELLNEVMKRHPRTLRIILSGYADQEIVLKCVGATHQYLTKPCSLESLRHALNRLRRLHEQLDVPELQLLVGSLKSLPCIPNVYFRIMEALQSPDCPIEKIGEIVSSDPALTSKMLQLVNSAFFGFSRDVSDAGEAVQLLGVGRIRSLALSILLFSAFDEVKFKAFSVDQIWQHSLKTAQGARQIVQMETDDEVMAEQALSSGLLHDVGKLILADSLPERYHEAISLSKREKRPLELAEREIFGADHAALGAYLLQLWGLPVPLVEAVAWHHAPHRESDPAFAPLTAVHIANSILSANKHIGGPPSPISTGYIEKIGCLDRLKIWEHALAKHPS